MMVFCCCCCFSLKINDLHLWFCCFLLYIQIHEKLKQYEKHSPTPVLHSASCLAEDVSAIRSEYIFSLVTRRIL